MQFLPGMDILLVHLMQWYGILVVSSHILVFVFRRPRLIAYRFGS